MFENYVLSTVGKLMTRADKVVVIFILMISIGMIILTPNIIVDANDNKQVVITLEDKELYRYHLEENIKEKRINFSFEIKEKKYQGTLRMKEGRVRLERLSEDISPLPIHAEMGWISEPYQMILCMPIKLAVTIESKNAENSKVDGVSY